MLWSCGKGILPCVVTDCNLLMMEIKSRLNVSASGKEDRLLTQTNNLDKAAGVSVSVSAGGVEAVEAAERPTFCVRRPGVFVVIC